MATEFGPVIEDVKSERLTTRKLLGELRTFAENNPRFRTGKINRVKLLLEEFDLDLSTKGGGNRGGDDDDDDSTSLRGVEYRFLAERFLDKRGQRQVGFDFSATTTLENVALPEYLAMSENGIDLKTAVEEIGQVALKRVVEFGISTCDRSLYASESYTYTDEDDDIVHYVSDDRGDGSQYDPAYYKPYGQQDETGANISQVISDEGLDRLEREKIIIPTPEEALALWANLSRIHEIDPSIVADMYDEKLKLAFGVLGGLRRVLQEQANGAGRRGK